MANPQPATMGGDINNNPDVFTKSVAMVPNTEAAGSSSHAPHDYQTGYDKNPARLSHRNNVLAETQNDFRYQDLSATSRLRLTLKEYMAEFMGTMLLVLFGDGSVAQAVCNPAAKGSGPLIISFGFAFALMLGVYISSPISGGHINPAITIANALLRKFPWAKVPGFIFSQLLGAFVGACLVMLFNYPAINKFDGGTRYTSGDLATAGIFATYPDPSVSTVNAFFIEMLSTSLLVIGILAINDVRHTTPSWFVPLVAGFLIGAIALSTGWMTGFALNPARDLGPRLFTMAAGWGTEPFIRDNHYFWVPLIAPIPGAIFGIIVYDIFITPPVQTLIRD